MAQLEYIESIEKKLWSAADNLRANSNYASNEYFLPVMGLLFLRHAYSRFLAVKVEIEKELPTRNGVTRDLTKEDFSQRGAIFLRQYAQYDYLVSLPDSDDRAASIIRAMESIEEDYESLKGELPKNEYQSIENDVLGQLLRKLNPEELKYMSGDVFGRIYEYFLTQFADQKAHDGGEFFTPVSLVSLIANILEPKQGIVLDPACGSGGMFVQSAHVVEHHHQSPNEKLTFYGLEKNPTTIRLAKMNLAVHGLEGNIQKAISYYEDPHTLLGKADYVMANPPFNVDEVDSEKIKNDPRLPFGLPGVNKEKKVSNGNYLWISYFYSYLNERGRAGFVMSSQASSAGNKEAEVRQKLIENGAVDIMISIRSNFFYTRSVPCELWFFDKAKKSEHKDKVLMIDARNIFRRVTKKIFDFSPEQQQNILAIIWLYRGETERFNQLVNEYFQHTLTEADQCFELHLDSNTPLHPLTNYQQQLTNLNHLIKPFFMQLPQENALYELFTQTQEEITKLGSDIITFEQQTTEQKVWWESNKETTSQQETLKILQPLADQSKELVKQIETISRNLGKLIESANKDSNATQSTLWNAREIIKQQKETENERKEAIEQLKLVRYFYRQGEWLLERFPEAKLRDVEGLIKLVDQKTLSENDWSLTPGRYVGVTPEEDDPDFDFEETMRELHEELDMLNEQSIELAKKIKKNFETLVV